jgi:uncharacterized membrane protein (DUF106 family)
MKTKGHLYFSAFLLLVSGYAIFAASRWSFKTGFFPLAIAIPLLILVLIHLYLESFGAPEVSKGPAVEADFSGEVPEDVARRRVVTIFAWIAAFILCVYLIGFPLTVPLFIFFFLKLQSEVSGLRSVGLTVITWGFFYLVFQHLVHIQFEAGAIQTWLGM